jgi:PhnB protein
VRLADAAGKVMHAELRIDNSPIMLADEFPDMGYRSSPSSGDLRCPYCLTSQTFDAQFTRIIAAGATETIPVADQFDGDRRGTLTDPFGHVWLLATRKENISLEEMRQGFETMMNQGESH